MNSRCRYHFPIYGGHGHTLTRESATEIGALAAGGLWNRSARRAPDIVYCTFPYFDIPMGKDAAQIAVQSIECVIPQHITLSCLL